MFQVSLETLVVYTEEAIFAEELYERKQNEETNQVAGGKKDGTVMRPRVVRESLDVQTTRKQRVP